MLKPLFLVSCLFLVSAPVFAGSPEIQSVKTSPTAADEDGTIILPNGSGNLHIEVKAKNAKSVRFYLTHMEVGSWEDRQLLYEDKDGSDGWNVEFPYKADEGFSNELIIEAEGASKSVHRSIFIHHSINLN